MTPNMSSPAGKTVAHMPMTTLGADIAPRAAQLPFPLNGLAFYRPDKPSAPLYEIALDVSREFDIPVATLRGHNRGWGISHPRQLLMLKAHIAGHSLNAIAIYLNNRDHTTVLHGIRAAKKRLEMAAGGQG